MNCLRILPSRSLVTTFCLLITCAAHTAPGIPGPPPPCEDQLVVAVTNMDFGSFVSGATGSIEMDATGAMVATGLILVGGSSGTPIAFDLTIPTSCKNKDVFFAMPTSFTISNLSGGPPTTFTISNLVSDLPTNPFRVSDVPKIMVGGTLTVSTMTAAEAPYSGPFAFTFTIP